MIIYLGRPLPAASCGLPECQLNEPLMSGEPDDILLDLAPGGVCLAKDITASAGGLLHHRFTLAD